MKKTILSAILLLGGISVMAQSQLDHISNEQIEKNRKILSSILAQQAANTETANKPTTIQQRVIAQSHINNNNERQDSFKYKYSGTHTSKYNFYNADFQYNTEFQDDYLPVILSVYSSPNSDLQADSILRYQQDTVNRISAAFYRADNKVDSFYDHNIYPTSDATQKILHTYNTQGFIKQTKSISSWSTQSMDVITITKKIYNGSNQLLIDTFYRDENNVLSPGSSNKYHYNAQNLLDSIYSYQLYSVPYLTDVVAVKYTADNKIQTYKTYFYTFPANLMVTSTDTFGYTSNIPYYTYYNSISRDVTTNQEFIQSITKSVGNNNLPDSIKVRKSSGANFTDISYKYTYNSYNNPVTLVGTDMTDTSYTGQINFYYETFDDTPPSAINDIKNNKDFSIYPNPFDNKINIDWKGAKANQSKIKVVNVLGQTVYSSNQNLITGTNTIDLPNLIIGNYILLIQDAKGNIWRSQLVKN